MPSFSLYFDDTSSFFHQYVLHKHLAKGSNHSTCEETLWYKLFAVESLCKNSTKWLCVQVYPVQVLWHLTVPLLSLLQQKVHQELWAFQLQFSSGYYFSFHLWDNGLDKGSGYPVGATVWERPTTKRSPKHGNATLPYCLEPALPEAHISGVQL